MLRASLGPLAAALAAILLAPSPATPGEPLGLPPPDQLPRSATSHVVVVVMENKEHHEVMSSTSSPYVRKLAARYATPARMFGIRHPSLPNYLALLGGDTFGVASNCTSCRVKARSLPDQLEAAGFTWRAYMEGMPERCFRGAQHGLYAKKHNPFMYFHAIANDPRRCRNVVPYRRLEADLRDGMLPDFAFITPDLCNDSHDCSVTTGDRHLARVVPALLHELGPHGILFLTWDEGQTDRGCCGHASGGQIPTVVAGPDVQRGAEVDGSYSLYSILRTTEEAFGVPLLRHARDARTRSMVHHFTRSHRGAMRKPGR